MFFGFLQAIPRTVWLDPNRRQLLQWPVEELNRLRSKKVELSNQKLYKGQHVEIQGITAAQVCDLHFADVYQNICKKYSRKRKKKKNRSPSCLYKFSFQK